MHGRATSRATPEAIWSVFTDPARMPEWFSGARDVVASEGYPRVGSTLTWRVGRWRFAARVIEVDAPRLLRQHVETPSATSTITHRVIADRGGAIYQKEVEAAWAGRLHRLLAKRFIARSVQREAERIAGLAEAPGDLAWRRR